MAWAAIIACAPREDAPIPRGRRRFVNMRHRQTIAIPRAISARSPYRSTAIATAFPPPRHSAALMVYIAANHLVDQRHQHARPARPNRMPQRHRAAIDVHAVHIQAQFAANAQRLYGERFIQLVEIDIVFFHPVF